MNGMSVLVAGLLLCFAVAPVALSKTSAAVSTGPATHQKLAHTLTVYGQVRPSPQATVAITAQAGAYVRRIDVTAGAHVDKGAVLLKLRTSPAAHAKFQTAQAQLHFAEKALTRQKHLLERHLATHADVASAEKQLADARSAYETQKELGTDQKIRTLNAPFAGTIYKLSLTPGQHISAGTLLLQLAQGDRLQAVLHLPATARNTVHVGSPVALSPVFGDNAGNVSPIKAKVSEIDSKVHTQTGKLDVRVELKGAEAGWLLPGIAVAGQLTQATHTGLTVPRAAIRTDPHGTYVFVVRRHVAHRVDVKRGIETNQRVAVTGHLSAGDAVVIKGNSELSDGQHVRAGQ